VFAEEVCILEVVSFPNLFVPSVSFQTLQMDSISPRRLRKKPFNKWNVEQLQAHLTQIGISPDELKSPKTKATLISLIVAAESAQVQLGSSSSPPSSSKKRRLPEPSTPLPSAPQPPPPSKKAKGTKSPPDLPSTTIAAEPTADLQTTPQLAELRRENESLRLQLLATATSKLSGGTNPPPNQNTSPPPSQGGQSTLVGVIAALTSVAGPPPLPSMPTLDGFIRESHPDDVPPRFVKVLQHTDISAISTGCLLPLLLEGDIKAIYQVINTSPLTLRSVLPLPSKPALPAVAILSRGRSFFTFSPVGVNSLQSFNFGPETLLLRSPNSASQPSGTNLLDLYTAPSPEASTSPFFIPGKSFAEPFQNPYESVDSSHSKEKASDVAQEAKRTAIRSPCVGHAVPEKTLQLLSKDKRTAASQGQSAIFFPVFHNPSSDASLPSKRACQVTPWQVLSLTSGCSTVILDIAIYLSPVHFAVGLLRAGAIARPFADSTCSADSLPPRLTIINDQSERVEPTCANLLALLCQLFLFTDSICAALDRYLFRLVLFMHTVPRSAKVNICLLGQFQNRLHRLIQVALAGMATEDQFIKLIDGLSWGSLYRHHPGLVTTTPYR